DQRSQRTLGEGDPGTPGIGQAHAMRRAEEQRRPELPLEALQAGGEGGLGDEERLGGPADAALAGDLEEALDLHQLDATRLPVTGFFYGHGGTLQILSIAIRPSPPLGRITSPIPRLRRVLPHKWGRASFCPAQLLRRFAPPPCEWGGRVFPINGEEQI